MRSEGKKRTLELSLIQGFSKIEKLFGGAACGLMYPCKHLYLNALPLAYIKKPRDWHV